jgi:hypothetical protein
VRARGGAAALAWQRPEGRLRCEQAARPGAQRRRQRQRQQRVRHSCWKERARRLPHHSSQPSCRPLTAAPPPPQPTRQAYTLYRLGRLQEAVKAAAAAEAEGERRSEALQLEAQLHYRLGDAKKCIACYDAVAQEFKVSRRPAKGGGWGQVGALCARRQLRQRRRRDCVALRGARAAGAAWVSGAAMRARAEQA